MEKCCVCYHSPKNYRRINGFQLPLNYQQVIGWLVLLATAILNFTILVEIQFEELKVISIFIFVLLYTCHAIAHLTACMIDPSEQELRKLKVNTVPEFDRSVHAHVIENGRCHLCNIHTTSKRTKHCGLCNKCVYQFDHHCKWLNNCIGKRNYLPFIISVISALLLSLFTSSLCLTDIILFLSQPQRLSVAAQNYINCTISLDNSNDKYCRNSILFIIFLILFCVSAFVISCALLHLCCFHCYIFILGVSTYEYIMRSNPSEMPKFKCLTYCNSSRSLYVVSKFRKKIIKDEDVDVENDNTTDTNVGNLINIIIHNELYRAKKMFTVDKNKVHPDNFNNHDDT